MIELPDYTDKEWLENQYNELGKTMQQIADEQGVKVHKIRNVMIEFNIPRRKYIGSSHPLWKGGRSKFKSYEMIGERPVHNIKMEKKIGRNLKIGEVVHHIDHNKRNNHLNNLYLCNNWNQHARIHRQFNRIAREIAIKLFNLGLIKFTKTLGMYYINQEKFGEEFQKYFQEEANRKIRQMDLMFFDVNSKYGNNENLKSD